MGNNNELCIGCRDFEYECAWEELNTIDSLCPCNICLVKSMCQNNCDDYSKRVEEQMLFNPDMDLHIK
jgi:hypothetical protein